MKHASTVLVVVVAVVMTACRIDTSEPSDGMAATISVAPDVHTLFVGDILSYRALAVDKHGTVLSDRFWEWGSTNESIAHVSARGVVTAVSIGTATIIASTDDRMGGAKIYVVTR
jgi:uncharacterized protein YjdB